MLWIPASVYFDNSPASSDQAKISFIVSRLAGKALEWATASWTQIHRLSYAQFLKDFKIDISYSQYNKTQIGLYVQLDEKVSEYLELPGLLL